MKHVGGRILSRMRLFNRYLGKQHHGKVPYLKELDLWKKLQEPIQDSIMNVEHAIIRNLWNK